LPGKEKKETSTGKGGATTKKRAQKQHNGKEEKKGVGRVVALREKRGGGLREVTT